MKKFTAVLLCVVMIFCLFAFTGCVSEKEYVCGYCNQRMDSYYSYIDGYYACEDCTYAIRGK